MSSARGNQLLTAPWYSGDGHSGRVCAGFRSALKRACVPDPEEIGALMLLAALAIAWNRKFGHRYSCRVTAARTRLTPAGGRLRGGRISLLAVRAPISSPCLLGP